jgi:hypothetical protein
MHRIQLCGGSYEGFTSAGNSLRDIAVYLEQLLPGLVNENKNFGSTSLIHACTPVVTKSTEQTTTHYPAASVPVNYKFPGKLLSLLAMDKFVYTDDNFVEFREVVLSTGQDGSVMNFHPLSCCSMSSSVKSPVNPSRFRLTCSKLGSSSARPYLFERREVETGRGSSAPTYTV